MKGATVAEGLLGGAGRRRESSSFSRWEMCKEEENGLHDIVHMVKVGNFKMGYSDI